MKHRAGLPEDAAAAPAVGDATVIPFSPAAASDDREPRGMEAALRKSVNDFRSLAEAMPQIVWVTRKDGWNVYVNQKWVDYTGLTVEETRGHGWYIPVHPDDLQLARTAWQEATNKRGPYALECRLRRADGVYRWCLIRGTPSFDDTGDILKWFGTCADIDDAKRTEAALRRIEDRHRTILQTAMSGFWLADIEGRLLEVNESYCRMSGYSEQELLTMRIPDLEAYKSADEIAARIQTIVAQGQDHFESRQRRKDGTVFDVEISAQYRPIEGGRLVAFLRDITERNQADEALKTSEARFKEMFDDAPVGYHEIDAEGRLVRVNRTELEMLGYRAEEMLGHYAWEFVEDQESSRKAVAAKLAGTAPLQPGYERTYCRKDGTRLAVLFHERLVPGNDGAIAGIRTTVQNITERKRAEKERAVLEAQLRQAQKIESVGRLAGGVAHDFNNMLGVILGHAELALEQVRPGQPLYADLTEIRKAAVRSANLTRQLLAFARKQTVMPEVLDLNGTVGGMITMLQRLIGEDIDLRWLPRADLWAVRVDPSQIDHVLANLCVNARDAISGVGKVTIETGNSTLDDGYCAAHAGCVPGEYVRLAVSDDGCGMDKETLSHLFEPFFTTKATGQGTGLGLATVYGVVKQNNGFIDVYSEPTHGTTFTIYLPRHTGKARQATPEAEGTARQALRGHETILVVEDEPSILTLTKKLLERQGYAVVAASTPGEALRLAEQHTGDIHLLITDVIMPEMNGRVLAKNLLAICPQIKRLFMSGYTADVIAHHGVLNEGVHFIQKPFSSEDLAIKVRDALDAPG